MTQQDNNQKVYSLTIGLETKDGLEINPMHIIRIIKREMDAGTFLETKGLWKGELENSIRFETIHMEDPGFRDRIENLKKQLEILFNQESVMMTVQPIEARF